MRGGVFTACLILLSVFLMPPLFRCHPLRKWLISAKTAFAFALALSVGTELYTYNAFLPGACSAIRRLLIPVMATPLFSAILLRVSDISLSDKADTPARWEFPVYSACLFLCWLPVLLAYWPGMLNYDFQTEYMQYIDGTYSLIHPLTHSALMIGVISLGEMIAGRTFGLLLMSLLQMTTLSLVLADACIYLRRRGLGRITILPLLLFFGLHPVFSVMSVSMTKDTLFAASMVGLCIKSMELLQAPETFLRRKSNIVLFIVFVCGTALMRVNGLLALVPMLIALFLRIRHEQRMAFCRLAGMSLGAALLIHLSLLFTLHPVSMPTFQIYSLPAQQLVRAYNMGRLSPEDKAELESWYVAPEGLELHPHLADPAKGYLDRDRLEESGRDFLHLWLRAAPKAGKEYLEAFLMLNIGSWYPDDLSHSTIYPDVSYNEKGYLQTQEYELQTLGFETTSLLLALRKTLEQICRYNRYQKYPILPILFSTAIPVWIIAAGLCIRRLKGISLSYAPATASIALFISYLFGPCTLPRYMMPLFILGIFFFLLALTGTGIPAKSDHHSF